VFHFHSSKQERLHAVHHGKCVAHMFCMNVVEELSCWPESEERSRRWVSVAEAMRVLRHHWMKDVLRVWVTRKGWEVPESTCIA
jgi:diphosphoinositol-polyphosphate diphosphatase